MAGIGFKLQRLIHGDEASSPSFGSSGIPSPIAFVLSFFAGGLAGAACTALLYAHPLPFERNDTAMNLLIGITAAIGVMTFLHITLLQRLFKSDRVASDTDLPSLFVIGALGYLGIWTDDLFALLGRTGVTFEGTVSYLTIVPAVVLYIAFVVPKVQDRYSQIHVILAGGGTLDRIERAKMRLIQTVRRGIFLLAIIQGFVTAAAMMNCDALHRLLGLPVIAVEAFRICLLGALMSALSMFVIFLTLILEDRKGAVIFAALFFGGKAVLAFGLLTFGYSYFSWSFLLVPLAALIWTVRRLSAYLRRLEAHALCSMAMGVPRESRT